MSGDRGSIFVETMIASALLAVMLGAAFGVLRDAAQRAQHADRMQTALLIAQSRLAAFPLNAPVASGRSAGRDGRYRWQVDAGAAPLGGAATEGAAQIVVTVASVDDARSAVTLRALRPGGR